MDTSARSHRRATWLIAASLLALLCVGVGYELNWIRQRRALLNGGAASLESLADLFRADVHGWSFECHLAPRGRTIGQRLLVVLGEPEASNIDVVLEGPAQESPRGDGEAWFDGRPIEDVELIAQVRSLYPEATICAHFTRRPPNEESPEQEVSE